MPGSFLQYGLFVPIAVNVTTSFLDIFRRTTVNNTVAAAAEFPVHHQVIIFI
jgi:hypothetical protein